VSPINTVVTSKQEILKACREIVSEQGLQAVNMRAVARRCGVALGSLYNYFPGKDALVLETIESVWQDIFHTDRPCAAACSFPDAVGRLFERVRSSMDAYPNFFTAHSLSVASSGKSQGRAMMDACLGHMKSGLAEALRNDPAVRRDCFSGAFCEADFLDFVLSGVLVGLLQQKQDCGVLLEVVRRTVYPA